MQERTGPFWDGMEGRAPMLFDTVGPALLATRVIPLGQAPGAA